MPDSRLVGGAVAALPPPWESNFTIKHKNKQKASNSAYNYSMRFHSDCALCAQKINTVTRSSFTVAGRHDYEDHPFRITKEISKEILFS